MDGVGGVGDGLACTTFGERAHTRPLYSEMEIKIFEVLFSVIRLFFFQSLMMMMMKMK